MYNDWSVTASSISITNVFGESVDRWVARQSEHLARIREIKHGARSRSKRHETGVRGANRLEAIDRSSTRCVVRERLIGPEPALPQLAANFRLNEMRRFEL